LRSDWPVWDLAEIEHDDAVRGSAELSVIVHTRARLSVSPAAIRDHKERRFLQCMSTLFSAGMPLSKGAPKN
jgi:hypothetical protein